MNATAPLKFKVATEDWEFELVHRLNYRTFVEEIPQHEPNPEGRLVDKFHAENTYLICLAGRELAGMLAFRGNRPFSLDQKLPNLDSHLPPGRSICELRLLAIDRNFRHSGVLPGLLSFMERYGTSQGYDTAIISGTTRQLKLYQRIGFKPFGPLVGTPGAQFQPMVLFLEEFRSHAHPILNVCLQPTPHARPVSFLPGPVAVHPSVRRAMSRAPFSHRSNTFKADFQRVQKMLCELTGAQRVELLLGSGTLANEAVAGQLSLLDQRGLIVSNGEFGERLIDQATRWGLKFETLKFDWGKPISIETLRERIERESDIDWLWAVHGETSTGVLNDVAPMRELCAARNIKLCLDCISTVGLVPVNLADVYLASAVSGKGVAGYPGIALVFANHEFPATDRLPRYLDVGFYARSESIPFTHSSNLLSALKTAVERIERHPPYARKEKVSRWLRDGLRQRGFHLLAPEEHSAPGVVTIILAETLFAQQVGAELEAAGFLVSYQSAYLRQRNWIQICLMGEARRKNLEKLMELLTLLCPPENVATVPVPPPSPIRPAEVAAVAQAG